MANQDIQVNMYDFNKANMAQIKPLDIIWFNQKCITTAKEIANTGTGYWMLLCRERYDFTVFHFSNSIDDLADAINECLRNRGDVIDFVTRNDGSYEIWIRDKNTKENFAYYLFDYNGAVIEV